MKDQMSTSSVQALAERKNRQVSKHWNIQYHRKYTDTWTWKILTSVYHVCKQKTLCAEPVVILAAASPLPCHTLWSSPLGSHCTLCVPHSPCHKPFNLHLLSTFCVPGVLLRAVIACLLVIFSAGPQAYLWVGRDCVMVFLFFFLDF